MSDSPKTIGQRLRALRKQKGYTLNQVGVWPDCDSVTIWAIEHEKQRLSIERLISLAAIYDTSMAYIVDGEDGVAREFARLAGTHTVKSIT